MFASTSLLCHASRPSRYIIRPITQGEDIKYSRVVSIFTIRVIWYIEYLIFRDVYISYKGKIHPRTEHKVPESK